MDHPELDQDARVERGLAGWFAQHEPTGGSEVIDHVMAGIARTPQRPASRWRLPVTPILSTRAAWLRAVGLLASIVLVAAAGYGLGAFGRSAPGSGARTSPPGLGGASPTVPGPSPTASPEAPALAPGPHLYWANNGLSTIGIATADGRSVEVNFISGAAFPCGVAVDGTHIYWANAGDGTIGRANLDGTGVDERFITGATSPCGVAVDAQHIYWTNGGAALVDAPNSYAPRNLPAVTNGSTIGRANLDGSGVDQRFITGASNPCGVAVDATHIFWANPATIWAGNAAGTIGRANLDGSGVSQRFVPAAGQACGVAVDEAHVYWSAAGPAGYGIGRANLNGTAANAAWIPGIPGPCGVAVNGTQVYWGPSDIFIGRANVDGSDVRPDFLGIGNPRGFPYACGVAVGP